MCVLFPRLLRWIVGWIYIGISQCMFPHNNYTQTACWNLLLPHLRPRAYWLQWYEKIVLRIHMFVWDRVGHADRRAVTAAHKHAAQHETEWMTFQVRAQIHWREIPETALVPSLSCARLVGTLAHFSSGPPHTAYHCENQWENTHNGRQAYSSYFQ